MNFNNTLGDRIQYLRKNMGMSQKDFAEFLGIPQPSLSAYENNRNSPTVDVLINIAKKCNISLDWLCGLSSAQFSISSLGDISDILYALMEIENIKLDIDVHDKLPNDLETETDRWYTSITVYGNDKAHESNADLCKLINKVKNNCTDLESFAISEDIYNLTKEKTKEYYSSAPTKKKTFPNLSREERLKKHIEALNKSAKPSSN